ncbi:hypothetical protein LUZ61_015320 [Rhynchospora tenuis]|uniref:BED-type domain-containing protein n=1 Tax=Rhynchospora tenuis TaxID=198213 RepID=A0AAD5WCH9_9POAL|nr:hypothetical protein LUZ61_015320 [Rhynchospora tenuis]
MADPKGVTGSIESEPSEPDIEMDIAAENEMDLHPGEQIRRIEDEANAQDHQGAPQGENVEANAAGGEAKVVKKRRFKENLKAPAWKHFHKGPTQDDGSYDAKCKYCKVVFDMGNGRGTGSLNHHIRTGCDKIPARFKRTKGQQMLQGQTGIVEGENKVAVWKFDQATCRKNLAIMVIVHEYPFNCVNHHYFRVFLKSLQPEFILVLFAASDKHDPRCKLSVVEYYFKIIYPSDYEWYISNLKACISEMFKEYSDAYSTYLQSQFGSSSRPHSNSTQASSSGSANVSDVRAGLREFMRGKKTSEPEKSEIDLYLCEPLDETGVDDEFDILAWWKLKVPRYPVLSRLTRDILAVPASTVASESTFSTSGRTLSTMRNCLNDESMEALICAQD